MTARGPAIDVAPASSPGDHPATSPGASPPARRLTRPRWHDPRLLVGLGLVALCGVLGARLFAAADDTVGVWAAGQALVEGQPVGEDDLTRVQVRFDDQDDADRYVAADGALPDGLRTVRAVAPGELLPRSAVAAGGEPDLVEVPLSVATEAVPATVEVGSVVDVWVTAGDGASAGGPQRAAARARLVFDDVAVVAVPDPATSLGPSPSRQVIVGVPPDRTEGLDAAIAAVASGAVTLTRQR